MNQDTVKILSKAISKQIFSLFGNQAHGSREARKAVMILLNHDSDFDIQAEYFSESLFSEPPHANEIHETLANLNEKELRRKKDGVFYTFPDVTNFITTNAFLKFITNNFEGVTDSGNCIEMFESLSDSNKIKLLNATVFDPTCGAGEFLITAINLKIGLIKRIISDELILSLANSIYGNDIAADSVYISKIRVFFSLLPYLKDSRNIIPLANTINNNFFTGDFINVNLDRFISFDIIVGNPPYVEYRNLDIIPKEQFGNTYANVLSNCSKLVSAHGTMGFIIPISFVSTKRMHKIRETIESVFSNICLLNYADRPDCLFPGVHQKLTILLAAKFPGTSKILSSSYNYWYKHERHLLFSRCDLQQVHPDITLCIPKIGNETEASIYSKCLAGTLDRNLIKSSVPHPSAEQYSVYLNMRNCFWIKAFSYNPGSNEYKRFSYSEDYADFVLCLLNSSLFFFFWIAVSDCWHITSKELAMFKLPTTLPPRNVFSSLSRELESKLEHTKVYVGTKQTAYEYKHKLCKDLIDKIDDAIAPYYNLTQDEVKYLKSYILKYRLNDES